MSSLEEVLESIASEPNWTDLSNKLEIILSRENSANNLSDLILKLLNTELRDKVLPFSKYVRNWYLYSQSMVGISMKIAEINNIVNLCKRDRDLYRAIALCVEKSI